MRGKYITTSIVAAVLTTISATVISIQKQDIITETLLSWQKEIEAARQAGLLLEEKWRNRYEREDTY